MIKKQINIYFKKFYNYYLFYDLSIQIKNMLGLFIIVCININKIKFILFLNRAGLRGKFCSILDSQFVIRPSPTKARLLR